MHIFAAPLIRSLRKHYLPFTSVFLIILGSVSFDSYLLAQAQPVQPSVQSPPSPTIVHAQTAAAVQPQTSAATQPASYGPATPTTISIPAINVRSVVTTVGLNADRTPQVPTGTKVDTAAWLTTSASPGTDGTAVIIGHVDTQRSGPSVFYNLHKLQTGQTISVARNDGSTATFTITAVRSFNKDSFPSREVYGNTGRPELRLITCGGNWDPDAHEYSANVVVFALLSTAP
jgi:sortase (surface protein transpeptidase)